jgi:hypothetical protein
VLPKAWSVASHRWETVDAWSWKKKPYARFCIGCHTPRYEPATRSYADHTVGCEACHGPVLLSGGLAKAQRMPRYL